VDAEEAVRDARPMRALALALVLLPCPALAQELVVQPYVQDRGPTSAWILWETSAGEESRVEWGPSEALGTSSTGGSIATEGAHRVHEVELSPLAPGTRYHYRVHTGAAVSASFHFTTPALAEAETSFRLVAVSDMQRDAANPEVWGRVVHEGILAQLAEEAPLPDEALSLVLLPGDLVDDGRVHAQWVEEFFAPAADLMALVPFYPVIGNHEENHPFFDAYFRLPEGRVSTDRYWWFDHGNVRIVGLDSNALLYGGAQEALLEDALGPACTEPSIDFVFVEMHHPYHSELWPRGESIFARQVTERMDRFARECGRPAVMFYGHTHAYSRGASRDAAHLWINVATAGGNIDYVGEYDDQYDDPEVQVSQDEWGFVVLDVEAGDAPRLSLRRYGMGSETAGATRVLRDAWSLRRFGQPPAAPTPLLPRGRVAPACTTLSAGALVDPDGDALFAAHFQVAASCEDWDAPLVDRYQAAENVYGAEDRAAGLDPRRAALEGLPADTYLCWRVRYRDGNLDWSPWSAPTAFVLEASGTSDCDDGAPLPPPVPADAGAPAASAPGCAAAPGRANGLAGLVALVLLAVGTAHRRVKTGARARG
jgi:hypothetical protein